MTEAVQTRMTYISGARDDMTPDEFTPQARSRKTRFARDLINQSEPTRDFSHSSRPWACATRTSPPTHPPTRCAS